MKSNLSHSSSTEIAGFDCKSPRVFAGAKVKIPSKFRVFLNYLTNALFKGNELQVRQHRDRQGNTWWQAFDPTRDESTSFGSEAEMRSWIEQRYYR